MSYALCINQSPIVSVKEKREMKWSSVNAVSSGTIKHALSFQMTTLRKDLSVTIVKFSMSSKRKQWIKCVEVESNVMCLK